jgi:hypothetical protein
MSAFFASAILAQRRINADDLQPGHVVQPFPDLQAGSASLAIDKYFLHTNTATAAP